MNSLTSWHHFSPVQLHSWSILNFQCFGGHERMWTLFNLFIHLHNECEFMNFQKMKLTQKLSMKVKLDQKHGEFESLPGAILNWGHRTKCELIYSFNMHIEWIPRTFFISRLGVYVASIQHMVQFGVTKFELYLCRSMSVPLHI